MRKFFLGFLIGFSFLTNSGLAGTIPSGYVVKQPTILWNASGSSATQGLASIAPNPLGTSSCTLSQVTQAQIPQSSFPGTYRGTLPGSGTFIKAVCSGGASGGTTILQTGVVSFVPGYTMVGMFMFADVGFNTLANYIDLQMCVENNCSTNRLDMSLSTITTYTRRQEGWNLVQSYCTPTPTFPDWSIDAGAPTCLSTMQSIRINVQLAANANVVLYYGDLISKFYAKPQITVWAADNDASGYTEIFTYMNGAGR